MNTGQGLDMVLDTSGITSALLMIITNIHEAVLYLIL